MTWLALLLVAAPLCAQDNGSGSAAWLNARDPQAPSLEAKPVWAQAAQAAIPAAAPWLSPAAAAGGVAASTQPAILLEETWSWDRLRGDLELIGRARTGLEEDVRELRRRRGQLLLKDPNTRALLPDHQAEAGAIWRRALDRLLALDSLIERYRRFDEMRDAERRAGAFLAAYAAYAGWSHWAAQWAEAAGDPELARLFDGRLPSFGVKAGVWSEIKRAAVAPARREALAQAPLYERSGKEGAALLKTGNAAAFALAGLRADTRGIRPAAAARGVVPVPVFEPVLKFASAAGAWSAGELQSFVAKPKPKPESEETAGLPAWSGASFASLSPFAQPWTSVIAATETVVENPQNPTLAAIEKVVRMLVEPLSGPRPVALIRLEQIISLAEQLEPGDILLWRRDRHVDEPGLLGWWTGAGIYIGTPEERERQTKSTVLDGRLNTAAPDAYWSSLKPDGGFAKRLVLAAPGGVRLGALERAAAADSLVALRPRLPRAAREQAALRALTAVGRPYDGAYDAADPKALYSMELVLWAYAETPLPLEPRTAEEAGPPSPNDLARTYDSQFGTKHVSFDVVRFLDGKESEHRAVKREPEDFRLSWKRPRWRFDDTAKVEAEAKPVQ